MKKQEIKTICNYAEARKIAEACASGDLVCQREVFEGRMQTIIKTKGGTVQALIGKNAEMFFSPIFETRGSGDGLFPWSSQTIV